MKIDLSLPIDENILNTILNSINGKSPLCPAALGHIGTHFDVMNKHFSLDNTERRGILFDISHITGRNIVLDDIDMTLIRKNDFIIFYSGCLREKTYGTPEYFQAETQLSNELIDSLIQKKISMIGIDFCGVRNHSEHAKTDQYCADNGIFIIENMFNLEKLAQISRQSSFIIHTYPLNYEGFTGLPCRVVAEINAAQ
ncbi:cyclase family protein [Pectinatus frisingensis]|uniref:cyclase family protein n=1 Tax=Pectinatus frisingensis TaxID=865 RepID=UPI0015F49020|nr:cyclase family protein [Pectinatus frisingensis]